MKELLKTEVGIIDYETGEVKKHSAVIERHYDTPKSLNFKGNVMTIGEKMSYICKGPKDIDMFWYLMSIANENNSFKEPSKIAKEADWDISKMKKFLKRGIEAGMWMRIGRGIYLINPYVFKGKKTTNKKTIELQKQYPVWNNPPKKGGTND